MSIRAMNAVWEHSAADGSELLLLLAIADHANDRGENAYPSKATLSKKTRQHERTVQSQIARLEAAGELRVSRGTGPGGTNEYVVVAALEGRTPEPLGGGETPPEIDEEGGRRIVSPPDPATPWGRIASGDRVISPGEALDAGGGDPTTPPGGRSSCASQTVLQPSKQPPLNRPEAAAAAGSGGAGSDLRRVPEDEELDAAVGRLCRSWENATATTVTAMLGDAFATWLEKLPEAAVVKAIAECGASGGRTQKYLERILERYQREGWQDKPSAPVNDFAASGVAGWMAKRRDELLRNGLSLTEARERANAEWQAQRAQEVA